MMEPIILTHELSDGSAYHATFLPGYGMNLISFKRGDIEVIDQSTKTAFDERGAGLGPLIGPHFHRRKKELVPQIENEHLFPIIAFCRSKGIDDPFSHGIGRYAPWKMEVKGNTIFANLSGKDVWNGVPLKVLEGQNFDMQFKASLSDEGLELKLAVVSDTASLVGIHYYYRLPKGVSDVVSQVKPHAYINGEKKAIPPEWGFDGKQLRFILDKSADYTFSPLDPLKGEISLNTPEYRLITRYSSDSEENAWQLYHPDNASFVCIEPVSAQDPRHPNLTVSSITIRLQIEPIR